MKWFRNMKIGKKLNLIVIFMVVLVVAAAVGFSIIEFTAMNISQAEEQAEKGVAGIVRKLEEEKANALKLSSLFAAHPQIIEGVLNDDRAGLEQAIKKMTSHAPVDFITITDSKGTVIFRAHEPDKFGDSVANQENVTRALAGESVAFVEKGTAVPLSARAGCPVIDDRGNIAGVVSTGTRLDNSELLDSLKEIYKTEMTIFLDDVRIATTIVNNGERVIGTQLDSKVADVVLGKKTVYEGNAKILGKEYITYYSPILAQDGSAIGVLFAGQSIDEFYQSLNQIILTVVAISAVLIIIVAVVLMILIRRSVTKPVKSTVELANALASGDFERPIEIKSENELGQLAGTLDREVRQAFKDIENARIVTDKQTRYQSAEVDKLVVNLERLSKGELYCDIAVAEPDEDTTELHELFGRISDSLHLTVNTLKTYIEEISEALGAMSAGDLSVSIDSEYRGDFAALKESINSIAESLSRVMSEINTAAEQVAAGTRQVSDGSQAISQGATEQSSAIEELSATVTEIAEQTKQNAASANQANELTLSAKSEAGMGNDQMKTMQSAMSEINEASANISKIIKVIDDIAFQTNILALNAAVEAARAGVYGKGFAVVAEEVRNLAARSANAAKETTSLIEGSIKKTEAGTDIANKTATALEGIVEGVEKTAQLTGQIAVASNEQATGITQVNNGIEQLSQVVQTNSATSEETAASAEELSSQAELLKSMVGRFKLKGASKAEAAEKKSGQKIDKAVPKEAAKPRIALSNNEFGKY